MLQTPATARGKQVALLHSRRNYAPYEEHFLLQSFSSFTDTDLYKIFPKVGTSFN
jgi:hypothetical protein